MLHVEKHLESINYIGLPHIVPVGQPEPGHGSAGKTGFQVYHIRILLETHKEIIKKYSRWFGVISGSVCASLRKIAVPIL